MGHSPSFLKLSAFLLTVWMAGAIGAVQALGQEKSSMRIGVGILQGADSPLSGRSARDTLVDLLNHEQLLAVPLDSPLPDETMGLEARKKNCGIVLVASINELAGPTVKPSVCVDIGIPNDRGTTVSADLTELGNAVVSDLNMSGSGIVARRDKMGCLYRVDSGGFFDTTGANNFYNKRVMFRLWGASDPRPILDGVATALLANPRDPATPQIVSGLAKQISTQVTTKILKTRPKAASTATAGIFYNLIDTNTVKSLSKGSAKGQDLQGSSQRALDSALGQAAKSIVADMRNVAQTK